MNVDIHDPAFQQFVINNMPVFMLQALVDMYRNNLGIERIVQDIKPAKQPPITEAEIVEFAKILREIGK